MASAIKIFRAEESAALETEVNAFLEGKTIVSISFSKDDYAYQAVIAYTETDATTEEDTTPATDDTTPTTDDTTPSTDETTETTPTTDDTTPPAENNEEGDGE